MIFKERNDVGHGTALDRRLLVICNGEQRTALYRFYDADEDLLYVGITSDPWRRWREHVQEKPWYPLVKHQAITWYEDRLAAEIAERIAIRRECPRFNVAGAVRPVAVDLPAELLPHPVAGAEVLVPEAGSAVPLEVPPVAEPAASPPAGPACWRADPVLSSARRGWRAAAIVLACAIWGFLPMFPGISQDWRSPWATGLIVSTPIPVIVVLLIAYAPKIHRLGRWLDLHFGPPQGSPVK